MILSSIQRILFIALGLLLLVNAKQLEAVAGSHSSPSRADGTLTDNRRLELEVETESPGLNVDQSGVPKTVSVQIGSSIWVFETNAQKVGAFLGQQEILIGPLDLVLPSIDKPVEDGLVVNIIRANRDFHMEKTLEAANTVWRGDPELPLDTILTRQSGKPGIRFTRTRLVSSNNEPPNQDLVESRLQIGPIDHVIVYGQKITKSSLNTPSEGSLTYWRHTRMLATSYSASNSGTPLDSPWYGYTFSGEPMGAGVVAADLDVIPLQTRLYIPGYGIGRVLDTGGGISGKHLDLGYEDDEYISWYSFVDVYWLWPPPADSNEIVWILPSTPSEG